MEKQHNVLVVGDDIVGGREDDVVGGWPSRLAKKMPEASFSVSAHEGVRLKELVRRTGEMMLDYGPSDGWSAVMVGAGLHDVLCYDAKPATSAVEFTHDIRSIYQSVQIANRGIRAVTPIIYLGLTPVNETLSRPQRSFGRRRVQDDATTDNDRIYLFDDVLKRTARWYECATHIPLLADFHLERRKGNSVLDEDGLYPNAHGHEVIATRACVALKGVLATLTSPFTK